MDVVVQLEQAGCCAVSLALAATAASLLVASPIVELLLGIARRVLASNRRLAGFAAALFVLPLVLIAI